MFEWVFGTSKDNNNNHINEEEIIKELEKTRVIFFSLAFFHL
jgi:hypothetical protein